MNNLRKNVLFVIPSFAIGGTIVSLNSLLSLMDGTRYSVDVFALSQTGDYKNKLPNCHILPENIWLSTHWVSGNILNRTLSFVVRLLIKIGRITGYSPLSYLGKRGGLSMKTDKYDAVICFSESISERVCHYPSKKKIAWIHCDYSRYLKLLGDPDETNIYSKFDKIVCVSEYAKSIFIDLFPLFKSKTVAIHNVINADDIIYKAKQIEGIDSKFDTSAFTIISVGRLDPVKQFDLIPSIADGIRKLTDKFFKWYIIGGSRGFESLERVIREEINKYHLEENVILLTEKQNVYPYLSQADLIVSTSMSESYPLVINEAKALGILVVANNFASAQESIQDGKNGFIVSCDKMAERIALLMDKPINSVKNNNNENNEIMNQIYAML